jgi:hypothetical protein
MILPEDKKHDKGFIFINGIRCHTGFARGSMH